MIFGFVRFDLGWTGLFLIFGVSAQALDGETLEKYRSMSTEQMTIDGKTMSRYEWSQEQRRIETAVRMQKDVATVAKASGDMKAMRAAQANVNRLMDYYDKISEESRIRQEYGRMAVQGYKQHSGLQETLKGDTIEPYKAMLKSRKVLKNSDLKNGLAIKSDANSIADMVDDSGKVLQRRVYGKDGRATTDFDTGDHKRPDLHPTGAHKHIFDYSKKRPRGINIPLTDEDLQRDSDIIKRGENYFDPE